MFGFLLATPFSNNMDPGVVELIKMLFHDIGPIWTIIIILLITGLVVGLGILWNKLVIKRTGYDDVILKLKEESSRLADKINNEFDKFRDHNSNNNHEVIKSISDLKNYIIINESYTINSLQKMEILYQKDIESINEAYKKEQDLFKKECEEQTNLLNDEIEYLQEQIKTLQNLYNPKINLNDYKIKLKNHRLFQAIANCIKHNVFIKEFKTEKLNNVYQIIVVKKLQDLSDMLIQFINSLDETKFKDIQVLGNELTCLLSDVQNKSNDRLIEMDMKPKLKEQIYKMCILYDLIEVVSCMAQFKSIQPNIFLDGVFDQLYENYITAFPDYIETQLNQLDWSN